MDLWTHYNHFIYTVSGKKMMQHPGKSRLLTEGSLVLLKKGAFCQGRFHDTDWRVIVFAIPDSYLQQLFMESGTHPSPAGPPIPPEPILDLNITDTTRAFFHSMIPYFTQQPAPPENLLELKFRELVFNLLATPQNAGLLAYMKSLHNNHRPPLLEIMEANYTYNLSLVEYARLAQRSLAAFKREFAEIFRTTPGKWLIQKRLDYARLLLDTTNKNINEIAGDSGFENTTHFIRVFKEKFGMPPLQYRKRASEQSF
jgi:AraC-like DNA-binding protein